MLPTTTYSLTVRPLSSGLFLAHISDRATGQPLATTIRPVRDRNHAVTLGVCLISQMRTANA
jgi:hypothetical protein